MIKNQVDHDRLFKELLETFFAEASTGSGAHGVAGCIFRDISEAEPAGGRRILPRTG